MFWKKKDKGKSKAPAPPVAPTREQILLQAKANMASARAEIGDETLDKIKAAMLKKQASAIEQAKTQLRNMDQDKLRDHLKFMMQEDKKK